MKNIVPREKRLLKWGDFGKTNLLDIFWQFFCSIDIYFPPQITAHSLDMTDGQYVSRDLINKCDWFNYVWQSREIYIFITL